MNEMDYQASGHLSCTFGVVKSFHLLLQSIELVYGFDKLVNKCFQCSLEVVVFQKFFLWLCAYVTTVCDNFSGTALSFWGFHLPF